VKQVIHNEKIETVVGVSMSQVTDKKHSGFVFLEVKTCEKAYLIQVLLDPFQLK